MAPLWGKIRPVPGVELVLTSPEGRGCVGEEWIPEQSWSSLGSRNRKIDMGRQPAEFMTNSQDELLRTRELPVGTLSCLVKQS